MILSTFWGSFLNIFRRFSWSFAGHVKPSNLMTLTRDLHGFSCCRRLVFRWFSVLFLHGFPACSLTRSWTDLGYFFGPFGHYFRMIFLYVFACLFGCVFWWFWVPKGLKRVPKGGPKSVQNQSKIKLGAETRFGPVLGPIWGRFSSNFGTILGRFRTPKRKKAADSSR